MRIILFLITCNMLFPTAGAQEPDLTALENRLRALEQSMPSQPVERKDLEILKIQFEKKLLEEKKHFDSQWNQLDRKLNRTEDRWYLFVTIGGVNLILLLTFYLRLMGHFNRELTKRFHAQSETLARMIKDAESDRAIKEEERLLIFTKHGAGIQRELRQQGFQKLRVRDIADLTAAAVNPEELDEAHHDLVIFDHLEGAWIDAYMAASQKTVFVAYFTASHRLEVTDKARLNFANGPMTLYARVLETARYRRNLGTPLSK